jgi:GTP cyclohydrolase II
VSFPTISKVAEANFPTRWGQFKILGFRTEAAEGKEPEEAVALVMGEILAQPPLVRIHSQCLTGDVFGSLRCDCRQQLEMALQRIAKAGCGILVYEQQEGRGIGLLAKLQAYELQDQGLDTVEANLRLGFKADCRDYAMPVAILRFLGVQRLRLLSNNPEKVAAVERGGMEVSERVPIEAPASRYSARYLKTKKDKMGHLFAGPTAPVEAGQGK